MKPATRANVGLVAFAVTLALSVYVLVMGSLSPRTSRVIDVGHRVPDMVLRDTLGQSRSFPGDSSNYLLVLCLHGHSLTPAQSESVDLVATKLASQFPFSTVALTTHSHAIHQLEAITSTVLFDYQGQSWLLSGPADEAPTLCIIDPSGVLRFRSQLPLAELPDLAPAPANRRGPLASIVR